MAKRKSKPWYVEEYGPQYNNKYGISSNHNTYKPIKGKGLKVTKRIGKLAEGLGHIFAPDGHSFGTPLGFIRDGVRCNGLLQMTGLIKLKKEAVNHRKECVDAIKRLSRHLEIIAKIEAVIDESFIVCPECKGAKGLRMGPNYWDDCDRCDGQGMVSVK